MFRKTSLRLGGRVAFVTVAVLAALSVPGVTRAQGTAAPTEMLQNPGLEAPYTALPAPTGKAQVTGAIAGGWVDDSAWADVTVEYAQAKEGAHGGAAAQSITVKSVRTGNGQFAQWLAVTPNRSYALSVWLKGQAGVTVAVGLRLASAPYTMLGQTQATLTGAWQQVTVSAESHDATRAGVLLYPPTGSTLLVDDASLTDVTAAKK